MSQVRMYSVTVYRLNPAGHRMWPEDRYETTNPDEIPALRKQAEEAHAKGIADRTLELANEDYVVTKGTMRIRIGDSN